MNITDEMVETATRANYDAMTWPGAWAEAALRGES